MMRQSSAEEVKAHSPPSAFSFLFFFFSFLFLPGEKDRKEKLFFA
jgi:hypothetical protein